jgi:nitrous oxidase accessory protein NosD
MRHRLSRGMVLFSLVLGVVLSPTRFVALAQGPDTRGLYVPPAATFIHDPAEIPIALEFSLTSLARVQSALDRARAFDPDAPIVLTLTGRYTVTDAPLTLPSNTSLALYGTIRADDEATASSLIAVLGQSEVAVAGGLLEGRGHELAGIRVEGSAKVNIDAVTITNTGRDGIVLTGRGNDVWNSGSAITRCEVSGAGGNGITVGSITQAILLDNFVRGSRGAGIQISAAHSSIVNNVTEGNELGIVVDGNDDLVSDNEVRGNRSGGLQLKGASSGTAVLRNTVVDNSAFGIDLDGDNNLVHANRLGNATNLVDRAAGNWVVARGTPLAAPVSRYFYPPTIDNRHADPVMNGRSRTDLAIDSSAHPTISAVQAAYDAARAGHPDDVIVLTLTGAFTLDATPLLLQSRTALVLDGVIDVPDASGASEAIRGANPSEFISISGGTIELNGRSREGIFFPSTTAAYVDGVTVRRGGERDVRAGKGMIHLQRGGGYTILRGNTVDTSGGRCIWTQNSNTRFVAIENYLTNCNQDGVDFDSSTRNSLAIGNQSVDNVRYGVFIEQSDSLNKIYGNYATTRGIPTIPGRAVGVYNNATSSGTRGITDKNTVFSNVSDVIADGLRVGSISTATGGVAETAHTFLFNNVVRNSRGNGILFDTRFPRSIENYFSQTVLSGNGTDLRYNPDPNPDPSQRSTPPEFFNPPPAVNLALRQSATASSSAVGSSPEAAVDGLAFTNWVAGDESASWLVVDLGKSVSFGRVMLKQTAGDGTARIGLQTSDDGVTFADLPGTAHAIVMSRDVNNVSFAPVMARFLRVTITELRGGPIGFEEISVHPR